MLCAVTAADGSAMPLGDLTYADISESVLCWLPVNRSTLDALSHACRATRAQIARHHDFGRTTFVCKRGCHIRFSQELDAPKASCGVILRYSDQLSSLHALSLSTTSLRAHKIAAIVSKCSSLRTLRLADTSADDKVVAAIACLAHVQTLDLAGCLAVGDFSPLAACKMLKSLNLAASRVNDRGIASIIALTGLEDLDVRCCLQVTAFASLSACRSLKRLNLQETDIEDQGLAAITAPPLPRGGFFV